MSDWIYSEIVREHFFNPRNLLRNENFAADGIGEVGSAACGDKIKIWLKIKNEKIVDCKWRTFGCASAIAATSVLSEIVTKNGGMKIADALKISPQKIVDALGGLPPQKIHCSVLGDRALRAAIENFLQKKSGQKISKNLTENKIICECKNLCEKNLKKISAKNFAELQKKTGIATICGKCETAAREFFSANFSRNCECCQNCPNKKN